MKDKKEYFKLLSVNIRISRLKELKHKKIYFMLIARPCSLLIHAVWLLVHYSNSVKSGWPPLVYDFAVFCFIVDSDSYLTPVAPCRIVNFRIVNWKGEQGLCFGVVAVVNVAVVAVVSLCPQLQRSWRAYCFWVVYPSVRPSVRPSVHHAFWCIA